MICLCPELRLLVVGAPFFLNWLLKGAKMQRFKNHLVILSYSVCSKDQVCKSIIATCSPYRRITKDKEEKTRKRPKKGPKRSKN